MITRKDVDRAERCTAGDSCLEHPDMHAIHNPWAHIDVREELRGAAILHEALEAAIGDSWDDDDSWESIAAAWVAHMAATHGAHCAGPYCEATADTPAYVGALRRMWRSVRQYDPDAIARAGYRDAIRDLAHELGVDLDG